MELKQDGYTKYSKCFKNIVAECNTREPDELVMGPVVGASEKSCKHYILEDGLHVYIYGEDTYVSDSALNFMDEQITERSPEMLMVCDESSTKLMYYDVSQESDYSYTLVLYGNKSPKEPDMMLYDSEDMLFLPPSFKSEDLMEYVGEGNLTRGELPSDIEQAIAQRREGVTPEALEIYLRILNMNDKIRAYEQERNIAGEGKKLLTAEDLAKMPIDKLEEVLRGLEEGNEQLRAEIRRHELMERIFAAQTEYVELDEKKRMLNQTQQRDSKNGAHELDDR